MMCGKTLWSAIGLTRGRCAAGFAGSSYASKLEMFRKRLIAEEIGRKFMVPEDELADVSTWISKACAASVAKYSGDAIVDWPPTSRSTSPVRRFLSLDLTAGTHFRTRLSTLSDTNDALVLWRDHPLAASLQTGHVRALYDRVAQGLAEFTDQHRVRAAGLPLVFTFGFPVRQTGSGSVVLQRWTKEFDCVDSVGHNVIAELRASVDRAGLSVRSISLLSEATAAMMNSVADMPDTRVGLVVDDGCNCCYVDRVKAQRRAESATRSSTAAAIVNTEWGAFGDDDVLNHMLTIYDWRLHARSRNPGKEIFEKMTSGMYMGELVRELVLTMTERGVLFGGKVTSAMLVEYGLKAAHLCLIESDARMSYTAGRAVLKTALGVTEPTDVDCELFRYACECVTRRSAQLVAAGLAGVLRQVVNGVNDGAQSSDKPLSDDDTAASSETVIVAVSGSVIEKHTKYVFEVGSMVRRLLSRDRHRGRTSFALRKADHEVGVRLIAGKLADVL